MTLRKINGISLHFPKDIQTDFDSASSVLKMTIQKPEANMQTDSASFEAWSLILKANETCQKIEVEFKELNLNESCLFKNLCVCQRHYMRFLYRLFKFHKQFSPWFGISKLNINEMNRFNEEFSQTIKYNNPPINDSDFKVEKGIEHVLEKAFVNIEAMRKQVKVNFNLFDQLPNGLFAEEVVKKNRIFNTGYFDLWGIDENSNFNVFELKKPGNSKAGILSELFFYANYAHDLLFSQNNFKLKESSENYRGYANILKGSFNSVQGIFLVTSFHSEIEKKIDEVFRLLNSNSPVSYSYKKYQMDDDHLGKIKTALNEIYKK